jgi:putative phosphoribosyl transferase
MEDAMTAILMMSPVEALPAPPALPEGCPLPAVLEWPVHPSGVVLVLHAGRRGESSALVDDLAAELRSSGLGTLMVDLMPGSRREMGGPAPYALLVERAKRMVRWLADQTSLAHLPVGLLGINGAAAPTLVAASASGRTEAVVVWGGEPDRAEETLARVSAPVLLLVGGADHEALRHHQSALVRLPGVKRLVAITRAGRACSGAETAAEAARWSAIWFVHHLAMERTWRHARSAGV